MRAMAIVAGIDTSAPGPELRYSVIGNGETFATASKYATRSRSFGGPPNGRKGASICTA